MTLELLERKRSYYQANWQLLSTELLDNYDSAFEVEYAHNSTAIEGNTLSLMETKVILEDKLSIGGKDLREIYEVINHKNAFACVEKGISQGQPLGEAILKDIHAILMENIMTGGVYRNVDVYISGAMHTPPSPNEMYRQIKNFYGEMEIKKGCEPIELAAWTHAEFVKIHPYLDGNGRTSRLIMNYQLMSGGYLPVSIPKELRLTYFEKLETYALSGQLEPFMEMIAVLEEERLDKYIAAIEAVKPNGAMQNEN